MSVYLFSKQGSLGQIASGKGYDSMVTFATSVSSKYPQLYSFFETGKTMHLPVVCSNIRAVLKTYLLSDDVKSTFEGLLKKLETAKDFAIMQNGMFE